MPPPHGAPAPAPATATAQHQQHHPQAQTDQEDDLLQLLEGFLGGSFVDAVGGGFADSIASLEQQDAAVASDGECVEPPLTRACSPMPSTDGNNTDRQQVQQVQQTVRRVRRRPPPPRKGDPNKSRNERKQELVYLHRKVSELEAQLRDLRSRAVLIAAEEEDTQQQLVLASSRRRSRDDSSAAAAVWQELVERQRELRTRSEKENIRLKLVLETQLRVVKSLEKLLLKPAATRELEKSLKGVGGASFATQYHAQFPATVPPDPTSDARVFDELLAGVAQSYAEIDALFRANGLAHRESAFSDARVRRDARGEMFMEICANKVLPFAVRATGEAVWHHFVFGKEKVPFRFHTDNAPKVFLPTVTSYLKDFGLEVHAKHKSASFRIKQVIRQHVERERTVIVWCAAIDPVAFSDQPLPDNTGIVEKGYIVMKPSASRARGEGSSDASALTLLQMCHVITPNLRTRTSGSSSASEFFRVGALTDFVLSATASNVTTSYHIVEDMLLEQSVKPHTSE